MAETLITLVDAEGRRSLIIGRWQPDVLRVPRRVGGMWKLQRFVRAPELDHEDEPPAYFRMDADRREG